MRHTVAFLSLLVLPPNLFAAEIEPLLKQLKAVGREGVGNVEAAAAWKELTRIGAPALLPALSAFRDASPPAANWLRTAVDAIAERELASGRPLPAGPLEAFVKEEKHHPAARRLAYEWLAKVDKSTPERLLPAMLNDPSVELRRDAIARVLAEAEGQLAKDREAAKKTYQRALAGARDKDQVDLIAKQLKSLGVEVDLPAHFGFITRWALVGPFDHRKGIGFDAAYPPEKAVDLKANYQGKDAAVLAWVEHVTKDPYGLVDLNKAIAKHMGAVAYAYAVVESPREQPVEVRAGSNNAVKLFLNGKQIFFREEYHHGQRMDQHVGRGTLKAGRNEVLIKVCQNEQTEQWAQSWSFQLRLCDAVGGAVPFKVVTGN